MRVIVGLGNPGPEYEGTRHNIGFAVVEAVAEKRKIAFESDRPSVARWLGARVGVEGACDVGWGKWRRYAFGVVKPLTYMNRSGSVVRKLMRKHGLDPQDLLIVFDDINLPLGSVRLRPSGGAGGHNGLEDIIDAVNSDNLPRMRIGIGNNFGRGQQSEYVLSPFLEEERPIVDETIVHAREAALTFVSDGIVTAMNRYNRRRSPGSDHAGSGHRES